VIEYLTQLARFSASHECPWPYSSGVDYLLDRGRHYSDQGPLDAEQLRYLMALVARTRLARPELGEPKACYDTSMLLVAFDEIFRVTYVEGYALTGAGVAVPHAWTLLGGKVVDLTRSLRPEATEEYFNGVPPQEDMLDRVLGTFPASWQYFGVEFPASAVRDYVGDLGETGSLLNDYQRGHPLLQTERTGNTERPSPFPPLHLLRGGKT